MTMLQMILGRFKDSKTATLSWSLVPVDINIYIFRKCYLKKWLSVCFSLFYGIVVTDVQFGHLFLVCIKYVALQEVTCGLFRNISHCS